MQNEKNNSRHWKQKLDDADFLSAQTRLNKEVAWQKLQQRLHKPKRKKAIAYWAVAACLLPLLIVVSYALHQKKKGVANEFVYHHHTTTKPLIKQTLPQQNNATTAVIKLNVEQKKTAAKKITNSTTVFDTNKKISLIETDDSITANKAIIANIATDSAVKTNVAIAIKTKLKIVHINELGEPVEAAPAMAHNLYPHSFSMQIGKEEVYASSARKTFLDSSRLKLFRVN